jgi:hypothetical protein
MRRRSSNVITSSGRVYSISIIIKVIALDIASKTGETFQRVEELERAS